MAIEISNRRSGKDKQCDKHSKVLRLPIGKRVKPEAITAYMLGNVPPSLQLVSTFVVLG